MELKVKLKRFHFYDQQVQWHLLPNFSPNEFTPGRNFQQFTITLKVVKSDNQSMIQAN